MPLLQKTCCFLLLSVACFYASAQVTVQPDKKQAVPGEAITLTIGIHAAQKTEAALGDTLGKFEVLKKSQVSYQQISDGFNSTQQVTITSFDSGKFVLPPIHALAPGIAPSQTDTIIISRMPADSLKGYGDVKNRFASKPLPQWPFRMGLLLLAIVSGYFLWRLVTRQKASKSLKPVRLSTPENWQKQMAALQQEWTEKKIMPQAAAGQLMLLIRELFSIMGMQTDSLTGEELLQHSQTMLTQKQQEQLHNAVALSYAILFAKFTPTQDDLLQSIIQTEQTGIALFSQPNSEASA
jgi:hypothetical protein